MKRLGFVLFSFSFLASFATTASAGCVEPDSLNFGFSVLDEAVAKTFTIVNETGAPATDVLVMSGSHPGDYVFNGGGAEFPYDLAPGDSLVVAIAFVPQAQYERTALVELGAVAVGCDRQQVKCCGYGTLEDPPSGMRISGLDWINNFPTTVIGDEYMVWEYAHVYGDGYVQWAIPTSFGDFDITTGGFRIFSDYHRLIIYFRPTTPGWHTEYLEYPIIPGKDQPSPMVFSALALADGAACITANADLDFGIVPVGETGVGVVRIMGAGTEILPLDIPESCGPFHVVDGPRYSGLTSGEFENIVIEFTPIETGPVSCELDIGQELCEPITLTGRGFENPGEADRIGVWFERTGTLNRHGTNTPYEEVTAYLMISNPSIPVGASGWECCVDIMGDVVGVDWNFEGVGLNTETAPCFSVGLADPVLGEQFIHLATVTFLQVSPDSPTLFYTKPIATPSLPDVPLYANGSDPGRLLPLTPVSGDVSLPVAIINEGTVDAAPDARATTILQAVPNPFNPSTDIAFVTAIEGRVRLEIFDVRGRIVRTLVDGTFGAGSHVRSWDGRTDTGIDAEAGVYMARLTAGADRSFLKLMLLK